MTKNERKQLRHEISEAWLNIQSKHSDESPAEVLPELLSSWLSLAYFIGTNHLKLSKADFLEILNNLEDID